MEPSSQQAELITDVPFSLVSPQLCIASSYDAQLSAQHASLDDAQLSQGSQAGKLGSYERSKYSLTGKGSQEQREAMPKAGGANVRPALAAALTAPQGQAGRIWLTSNEAARVIGVTVKTVRRMGAAGRVRAWTATVRDGERRCWRFLYSSVYAYVMGLPQPKGQGRLGLEQSAK